MHSRNGRETCIDFVFAFTPSKKSLKSCRVRKDPDQGSDHSPILSVSSFVPQLWGVVMDTTLFVMDSTLLVKDTTPHVAVSSYKFIIYKVKQISLWIVKRCYITVR